MDQTLVRNAAEYQRIKKSVNKRVFTQKHSHYEMISYKKITENKFQINK